MSFYRSSPSLVTNELAFVVVHRAWRFFASSATIAIAARATLGLVLSLLAPAPASAAGPPANRCAFLNPGSSAEDDAAAALVACLGELPPGGRVELPPGVYRLRRPLVIGKSVTVSTRGLSAGARTCADLPAGSCATLLIDPDRSLARTQTMPILVAGNSVTLSHLVIKGTGPSGFHRAYCANPGLRPFAGGIRVSGSNFMLVKSSLRDITCYSALEITNSAMYPVLEDNVIGPNGDHGPGGAWTDGATIHDTVGAVISRNLFIDNTDVQLILGGCRSCVIANNRFRHSGVFRRGSFAALMLHAWPTTSGNYAGTIVSGNDVDCSTRRSCGYGIMIGSAPWYKAPMAGGRITGNRVADAMIGINVDALSGPVDVSHNSVQSSGGRFASDCGVHDWPSVNIGPGSRRFVRGDVSNNAEGSLDTAGCLLNRQGH